ncbi:MAG: hypothetical protein ACRD30_04915 [Bryobacteraceae bacterium]
MATFNSRRVGLRWTVGDVSQAGFEVLQISIWSAWNLFGERAEYAVCVNTVTPKDAQSRTGEVPKQIRWIDSSERVPGWLASHLDRNMAEGVAWKFAPVRLFPERYEIALDNDVVLWRIPQAVDWWIEGGSGCLLAEDVQCCLGQFADRCDCGPVNSGIRGVPPGFDLETRLCESLGDVVLQSELDEQGLQAAALSRSKLFMVPTRDVTICSPFPAHQHNLGECGVHFVGLNAKRSPWMLDGRGAHEVVRESWERFRPAVMSAVMAGQ